MHRDIHSGAGGKKDKQISFRVEPDLADNLDLWARREEISVADLARKLIRIAAKAYRQAGSLHELRKQGQSTDVPGLIDEKSYGRGLNAQVLTDAKRTAQLEKVGRAKGKRARSKPAKQQEKTPGETDRDRTPTD